MVKNLRYLNIYHLKIKRIKPGLFKRYVFEGFFNLLIEELDLSASEIEFQTVIKSAMLFKIWKKTATTIQNIHFLQRTKEHRATTYNRITLSKETNLCRKP